MCWPNPTGDAVTARRGTLECSCRRKADTQRLIANACKGESAATLLQPEVQGSDCEILHTLLAVPQWLWQAQIGSGCACPAHVSAKFKMREWASAQGLGQAKARITSLLARL